MNPEAVKRIIEFMVRYAKIVRDVWWNFYILETKEVKSEYYKMMYTPELYIDPAFVRAWKWWVNCNYNWIRYRTMLSRDNNNNISTLYLTFRWRFRTPSIFEVIPSFPDLTHLSFFHEWYGWSFSRAIRFHLIKRNLVVKRFVHPYHIVNPSPWPLLLAFGLLLVVIGAVQYFHFFTTYWQILVVGLPLFVLSAMFWWRDVIREGTFEGQHTSAVQRGLRYGIMLFILSEVMFFSAFFWAFFHSSLSPAIEIGGVWPPLGIDVLNPWRMPLLNTMYLLASGACVTWVHCEICFPLPPRFRRFYFHSNATYLQLINKNNAACLATVDKICCERDKIVDTFDQSSYYRTLYDAPLFLEVIAGFLGTIAFGLVFTFTQWCEYDIATFTISDGIYGSVFYMATGFHGLHVIIGTIFLIVCLTRYDNYHFTKQHHVGLEAAVWYWHFVDVVWLFLYVCIYHWGS